MKKQYSIEIEVSAEQAWQLVGEGFGDIAQWSSALEFSRLEGELAAGGMRVCRNAASFGPFKPSEVREQLDVFTPNDMMLSYTAISGVPKMFKVAKNEWKVTKLDNTRCRIELSPELQLAGILNPLTPIVFKLIEKDLDAFLLELKNTLEQNKEVQCS